MRLPIETSGSAIGWIETKASITPFVTDVSRGGQYSITESGPAGTVVFPAALTLAAGERVRLVSLTAPREGAFVRPLFTRDLTSTDAKARMPAGSIIALLLDAKGRVIAASPIMTLVAGREAVVWPRNDGRTALVAWLKRPRVIEREDQDTVALTAVDATGAQKPSALINAADAVFAVWYDVAGNSVRLVAQSPALRLERDAIDIARGSVTTFEAPLRILPSLTVSIAPFPSDTANATAPMKLAVREMVQDQKVIGELVVEPGRTYEFEAVPAAMLRVDLRIGDFVLHERSDLTSGLDSRLDIRLEPVTISGTVYFGDTPARAVVQIQQTGEPITVETDDRGAYAVTLWQLQRYVVDARLVEHPDVPPFSQLVRITGSTTLDIRIPANSLRARVYDASNGKPIGRAEIFIQNRWGDASGQHSTVKSIIATGDLTPLPPQRSGTSEIRVRAAGYSESEAITVTVDANLRKGDRHSLEAERPNRRLSPPGRWRSARRRRRDGSVVGRTTGVARRRRRVRPRFDSR